VKCANNAIDTLQSRLQATFTYFSKASYLPSPAIMLSYIAITNAAPTAIFIDFFQRFKYGL